MSQLVSAGPAWKDAFFDAVTALHVADAVQVSFGPPGMNQAEEMIGFMEFTSVQEPVTIGSRRQREENLELTVRVSCWQGGVDSEKGTSDRALALLGDLENYARVTDTTFGGLLLFSALTSYQVETTPPEFLASGRLTEVSAVFSARARITS